MVPKDHRMHLDPFYDQKMVSTNLGKTIEKRFPKSMYTLKKNWFGPKNQKISPNWYWKKGDIDVGAGCWRTKCHQIVTNITVTWKNTRVTSIWFPKKKTFLHGWRPTNGSEIWKILPAGLKYSIFLVYVLILIFSSFSILYYMILLDHQYPSYSIWTIQ